MSLPSALLLLASAAAGPRGLVGDPAPPQGLDAALAPKRVAVVVGIDSYDDPALGSLRHASMLDLWQGEQMQAVRSEALRRIPVEQRTGCPLWLPAEDRS